MQNDENLQSTAYLDYQHPAIQTFIEGLEGDTPREKAVALYYRIRDDIHYNPYTFSDGEPSLKASYAASRDEAFCVPKSALMVAGCRALGIPARMGLADVRNHLSSPRLLAWLGTDLFVMHGYASVFLDGKWVKCTPVFNKGLCEKFGIHPLEFNGSEDSLFHEFNAAGHKHMEYVTDHGTFADMPVAFIFNAVKQTYPHIDVTSGVRKDGSLETEI